MAIIAVTLGCAIGFLGAAAHVLAFGGSVAQGLVTYFVLSIAAIAAIALAAWAKSKTAAQPSRPQQSFEDQLEDWMDWQMQEDIEDASMSARAPSSTDETETRKSA
jgi:F0F1-type ATP synthase membrane subunit a